MGRGYGSGYVPARARGTGQGCGGARGMEGQGHGPGHGQARRRPHHQHRTLRPRLPPRPPTASGSPTSRFPHKPGSKIRIPTPTSPQHPPTPLTPNLYARYIVDAIEAMFQSTPEIRKNQPPFTTRQRAKQLAGIMDNGASALQAYNDPSGEAVAKINEEKKRSQVREWAAQSHGQAQSSSRAHYDKR